MADHVQANLTLQDAYTRAKSALESGAPDRAIAIAQHILRFYPRYADAYRLLGEAYLERGQADEALRLFTHVLQVDPQNVLAHIGRAIIAEERGEVEAAIEEYERAFEVDPSIPELRTELLRLYKVRDGSAGASIRTTPSGLAYVHLRAGLRDAAISEFSTVAQMRPDRWDLEVALAEALWRNEQLDEAAAVCGDVLASHPSCAKCNWLLGYVHWTSGRTESGRKYLLDAVALDPSYAIAGRIWEATPWPVDRNLTRPQPALIPGWSSADLDLGDLNLDITQRFPEVDPLVRPSRDTRPLEQQRITQKFDTMPPLPVEHAAATTPAEPEPPPEAPPPAPLDLDWFDDWAAAAETPAPDAQAAPVSVEAAQEEAPAEVFAPLPAETPAPADFGPAPIPEADLPDEDRAPAAEASILPSWLDNAPEASPADRRLDYAERAADDGRSPMDEAAAPGQPGEVLEESALRDSTAEPVWDASTPAPAGADESAMPSPALPEGAPDEDGDSFLAFLTGTAASAPAADEPDAGIPRAPIERAEDAGTRFADTTLFAAEDVPGTGLPDWLEGAPANESASEEMPAAVEAEDFSTERESPTDTVPAAEPSSPPEGAGEDTAAAPPGWNKGTVAPEEAEGDAAGESPTPDEPSIPARQAAGEDSPAALAQAPESAATETAEPAPEQEFPSWLESLYLTDAEAQAAPSDETDDEGAPLAFAGDGEEGTAASEAPAYPIEDVGEFTLPSRLDSLAGSGPAPEAAGADLAGDALDAQALLIPGPDEESAGPAADAEELPDWLSGGAVPPPAMLAPAMLEEASTTPEPESAGAPIWPSDDQPETEGLAEEEPGTTEAPAEWDAVGEGEPAAPPAEREAFVAEEQSTTGEAERPAEPMAAAPERQPEASADPGLQAEAAGPLAELEAVSTPGADEEPAGEARSEEEAPAALEPVAAEASEDTQAAAEPEPGGAEAYPAPQDVLEAAEEVPPQMASGEPAPPAATLADEHFFEWIGRSTPYPEQDESGPDAVTAPAAEDQRAEAPARPIPAPAAYAEAEPTTEGPGDHELREWLGRTTPYLEHDEAEATPADAGSESFPNPPEVSYNQSKAPEAGEPVSPEEVSMAPSYKEDDDQERQFDFDWDHEALPDYLKPFLVDEAAASAPGAPASPTATSPGAGFASQTAAPRTPGGPASGAAWPPVAGMDTFGPAAAAGPANPTPAWPAPEPTGPPPGDLGLGADGDLDLGNIQPFDFGAAAGAGGEFDFGGEALPSWLGSAPASQAPEMSARPMAADETPGPDLDSPGLPDWLRTPAPETAPAAAPPPAPAGEFDFGSNALPSWLGGGAAGGPAASAEASAPAPFSFESAPAAPQSGVTSDDLSGIAPFSFGAPAEAAPFAPAGGAAATAGDRGTDYDLAGIQPFDFGAPASAHVPSTPTTAPLDESDFGGLQPFDFGAPAGAPAFGEPEAPVGSDDDDFIDFLSATMGAPPAEPAAPSASPFMTTPLAPAPPAPGGFDFEMPLDVEPFSLEGLDLGAPAGMPSMAPPSSPPPPAPSVSLPPPPPLASPELGLGDMSGLAADEFNFEPFMFDEGAFGGDAFAASAPPTPAASGAGSLAGPPPAPRAAAASAGPAPAPSPLPPGLEDLPDLQPFSFEGESLAGAGGLGRGLESADQERAFGRRASDREAGRAPVPFSFEEESDSAVSDVHNFSWQRASTPARSAPAPAEADELSGSIFAKAKKRKEALEQTMRRDAEAGGEVLSAPHTPVPATPEEEEEIGYWPNFDEDEEVIAPVGAEHPADLGVISGMLEQDMADLQLTPFTFEEEAGGTPEAAFAPQEPAAVAGLPAEFALFEPSAAPTMPAGPAAEAPAGVEAGPVSETEPSRVEAGMASGLASEAEAAPGEPAAPGELLWSIPVAEPGAAAEEAPPAPSGLGEEIAPGEFDFTGLQPFDLSALELTPEERAYLVGDQAAAPVEEAAPDTELGIPELPLDVDFTTDQPPTTEIEPFSFDAAAFEAQVQAVPFDSAAFAPPAAEAAGEMPGLETPAEAFDAGEFGLPGDLQPFDPGAFAAPAAAEPFASGAFGLPAEVQPVDSTAFAEPEDVQPFDFGAFAVPSEMPAGAAGSAGSVTVDFAQPAAEHAAPDSAAAESPFASEVEPFSLPEAYGAPAGEVSPLAAESWSETPMEGDFDFSGVQMEPLEVAPEAAGAEAAEQAGAVSVPALPEMPGAAEQAPEMAAPAEAPEAPPPEAFAAEPAQSVAEAAPPTPVPAAPAAPAASLGEMPAPSVAVPAQPAPAAPPSSAPAGGSIDDLVRYLDTAPDDAAARLALAIGYEQRDDYTRAADQYRRLIKGRTVPANVLDIVTGNLRELVESQPDDAALHRLLGDAYMKQGQFQMAISQYNWLLTKGTR